MNVASPARLARELVPASPRDVVALQAVRAFPAVSVLMSTTPAATMTSTDQDRLSGLVDAAVDRLRRTAHGRDVADLAEALADLGQAAVNGPTDLAVGLFAGAGNRRALRLGVPVADRAVVESSFVTRDLVFALQRAPRHVVLVLNFRDARLYDAVDGVLRPAATAAFPLRAGPSSSSPGIAEPVRFLQEVDRRLGTYRRLHPSPLVLVGPAQVLASFTASARHIHRLAGTLSGDHVDDPLPRLAELTKPVLHRYLSSREAEALTLLAARAARGRVASGMQRAWLASRTEEPEVLAVERGLFYPATLDADGHTLTPATDLDDPDVISDAVDELIEHVLVRGGWVAIVEDDKLSDHGGVALALR